MHPPSPNVDLVKGRVSQIIPLEKPSPSSPVALIPRALLLNHDDSTLYVALTNRDKNRSSRRSHPENLPPILHKNWPVNLTAAAIRNLSRFPPTKNFLFRQRHLRFHFRFRPDRKIRRQASFLPNGTRLSFSQHRTKLLIASAKGRSSGPNPNPIKKNPMVLPISLHACRHSRLARANSFADLPAHLAEYTKHTLDAISCAQFRQNRFRFRRKQIRHVIYIIKEKTAPTIRSSAIRLR